jgi:hypothetical protein
MATSILTRISLLVLCLFSLISWKSDQSMYTMDIAGTNNTSGQLRYVLFSTVYDDQTLWGGGSSIIDNDTNQPVDISFKFDALPSTQCYARIYANTLVTTIPVTSTAVYNYQVSAGSYFGVVAEFDY